MEFIKIYIISAVCFLLLDSIWLGIVAPKFYKSHIGKLMAKKADLKAAVLFYTLFIIGLVYFVVQPAVNNSSLANALSSGALFGLVSYGTYDLTSQAIIKDWPWVVTVVDLLWGTFICASVSGLAYIIANAIIT